MVIVGCGGGAKPAAPAEAGTGTEHAVEAEPVKPEITKERFDELRLKVLELEVEVDQLQTAAGISTEGEEPAEESAVEETAVAEPPHWTYAEAERWGALSAEFSACSEGFEQSPIDLGDAVGADIANAAFSYIAAAEATIIDNGHTVQVNVPTAGTLELDGVTYQLLQLDFHAPSEHTIDGANYPLEVHFVHKSAEGALAVIGVLIKQGDPAPAYDIVVESLPLQVKVEDKVYGQIDVASMLPALTTAFRYDGSLTTPPCSEGVEWSVLQTALTMSAEQINAFTAKFAEPNNRPVQPIGNRELVEDLSA